MRWSFLLLALLAADPSPAHSIPPLQVIAESTRCEVSIRVTNGHGRTVRIATGPADLTAEVRVPPAAGNRLLVITWDYAPPQPASMLGPAADSPEFGLPEPRDGAIGSTEVTLDGEAERLRHDRPMKRLSGGTYEVTARVYRNHSKTQPCGTAKEIVRVTGGPW